MKARRTTPKRAEAAVLRCPVATLMASWLLVPVRPGLAGGAPWVPGHMQPRLGEASGQLAAGLPRIPGQLLTPDLSRPFITAPLGGVLAFHPSPLCCGRVKGLPRTHYVAQIPGCPLLPGGITQRIFDPLLPTRTQDSVLRRVPRCLCVELSRAARPSSSLAYRVALDKSPEPSVPQFPHPCSVENSTSLRRLAVRSKKVSQR